MLLTICAFQPASLTIEQNAQPKPIPPPETLTFGSTFSDHMLSISWDQRTGWHAPRIHPYGPMAMDPSTSVLHYANTCFEGMKAYVDAQGKIRIFRPDLNMKRLNKSAKRLGFPSFTGDNYIACLKRLLSLDKKWIPTLPGYSLYIRPTMISTTPKVGLHPPTETLLFTILSPVGPYYKTGFKPISLLATTEQVRAWPGGTGGHKLGANYAATIQPALEASLKGYQQILWLQGDEHQLTEVGAMNLFVVVQGEDGVTEVVTPPLADTVLEGVTRDSILSLLREHASGQIKISGIPERIRVSERKITMPEVVRLSEAGRLQEMFGCGTAAVVTSVRNIGYKNQDYEVPVGQDGLGDFSRAMLREIVGRQLGQIPSDWSVVVA
ncbi:branched-chain amino acid aminotransferase II [Atractiella rhizophila]|nr:branched-chain amino acid aminotransferase II [Atractiella rhizophila]